MNIKYYNYKILIPVLILCIISLITLVSLIPQLKNYESATQPLEFVFKQSFGMCVGLFAFVLIQTINFKKMLPLFNIGYWILYGMLVLLAFHPPFLENVLVSTINGASGWFTFFGLFTIQPIEFMKIFFFIKMGKLCSDYVKNDENDLFLTKQFLVYAGIPIFCTLLQPDLGGAVLLAIPSLTLYIFCLKSAQNRKLFLIAMIVGFTLTLYVVFTPEVHDFLIKYTPLEPHQLSRITVWLKPFESSEEDGLQLSQSLILVGSSGIFGHGPGFYGVQLPEPHTDVIFSEATGMFGIFMGLGLISLYAFLTNEIISVAKKSDNMMYTFICIGYSSLFAVQCFENIGMMIGVFPITGIVLPFMSYGVSALLSYFVIMGIVSKISSDKKLNPELFDLKDRHKKSNF